MKIEGFLHGIVLRKNSGLLQVLANGTVFSCNLAPAISRQAVAKAAGKHDLERRMKTAGSLLFDLVVVGDRVRLAVREDQQGTILEVLPRENQFSRRSAVPMPGARPYEQVIAANIDQLVPVFSAAQPEPHWNMLDRYLVSAEARELPVLICITKMDLASGDHGKEAQGLTEELEIYRRIGYPLVTVSVRTGQGLGELKRCLAGRISLLVGKSGVGKSSLLNAILPGFALRVNSVNPVTGKGRHTTTGQELFLLDGGGAIVDTPGEREFGLWGLDAGEVADCFPEMRPFLGSCRFGLGCLHNEEIGCVVRKAVMSGQISPRRYQSLLRLQEEMR